GIYRISVVLARFAPKFNQGFAYFGVFQTVGAVDIPGIAGTARAAARLVIGQIRTGARVIGLLGFPGHQPVFDIDFPATGTGAVNTVGRANNFVVLPALTIGTLPLTTFVGSHTMALGKGLLLHRKKAQLIEKMTHEYLLRKTLNSPRRPEKKCFRRSM